MMNIDDIADNFSEKYIKSLSTAKPENLRSLIWQAVNVGMQDAYERGLEKGFEKGRADD